MARYPSRRYQRRRRGGRRPQGTGVPGGRMIDQRVSEAQRRVAAYRASVAAQRLRMLQAHSRHVNAANAGWQRRHPWRRLPRELLNEISGYRRNQFSAWRKRRAIARQNARKYGLRWRNRVRRNRRT